MIIRALVVLFGMLAASSGQAACTVDSLASKVAVLDAGLPPATSDFTDAKGYHRPFGQSTQRHIDDLKAAFELAHARSTGFFQTLCALSNIFIDTTPEDPGAPIGWGFWEGPGQGDGTYHAIGISEHLWDQTFKVTGIENQIVKDLLRSPFF